jgi:hypothetical protein
MKFPKLLTNQRNIIIFLLVIILILAVLFYLFDEKNIQVQQHLNKVYLNSVKLHEKYPQFINKNPNIIFENDVYIINNVLNPDFFKHMKTQLNDKSFQSKDVYFRKATGINFFDLHGNNDYDGFLEFYYSSELTDFLATILKKPIQKPPLSDPNACSLLIYSNKGDHIDWHKDYSLHNGDRYVVLLTVVNENADQTGLSQNEFTYTYNGKEFPVKLQENSIIIFKGSEILHKSTSIDENERRILLSMTFCDICQEKKNIVQYVYEKIKNMVVYQ